MADERDRCFVYLISGRLAHPGWGRAAHAKAQRQRVERGKVAVPVRAKWCMTSREKNMSSRSANDRTPGFRFGTRGLFLLLTLLCLLLAAYAWLDRRILEPGRRADAVQCHLESLASRRPDDMSPRQWESAVAWTLNLHGNSFLRFQADGPAIAAMQRRLESRLADPVGMDTIHWIWDEYGQICQGGANYQRFRAMMIEEIDAGGGNWNMQIP
jgi:hypothetical protein